GRDQPVDDLDPAALGEVGDDLDQAHAAIVDAGGQPGALASPSTATTSTATGSEPVAQSLRGRPSRQAWYFAARRRRASGSSSSPSMARPLPAYHRLPIRTRTRGVAARFRTQSE